MGINFDGSTIPDAVIEEVTMGLLTEEQALADEICTIIQTPSLAGVLPNLGSAATLGRLENSDLQPLVEAEPHGGSAGSTAYDCLAQVGYALISDEERAQFQAFGLDFLANRIRQARANANLQVDNALATVLASTSLNAEFDTTSDGSGEWDDATNGTPLEDIVEIIDDFAPGADTIVYGPETRRILIRHPDLVAEFSNFSGGQLDADGLRNLLSRKTGIPVDNIYEFKKLYNAGPKNGTVSTAYLFDEGFWVGHKRDLICVDPTNPVGQPAFNNLTEVERVVRRRAHEIQHTRYVDFLRPTTSLGCTVSLVATP